MHRMLKTCLIVISSLIVSLAVADTRDAELKHYDQELNIVYKKIMAELSPKKQEIFREAQRAWISMRDKDCQWAFVDARDCLIDRTMNRASELKGSLFETKNGEYKEGGEL